MLILALIEATAPFTKQGSAAKKQNPSRDDPESQQLFLRKWVLGGYYYY